MKRRIILLFTCVVLFGASCAGFHNAPTESKDSPYGVISPIYNEIICDLGAQNTVVGIDLSTTYPPEVKNVHTGGSHRPLSAEGILSLHPTEIIHDNNIGPPQVVQQLQQLNIPMKTFAAKNDSFEDTKALIREMGAYFHKESRAEELCHTMDTQRAASLEKVKQYTDHPRVAVIHFGRASNVYLVVGKGGGGGGGGVSQMIELAGGEMAVEKTDRGMQRMESPEIIAKANPDVILMTDYGYDRLNGSSDQIKALPGVATSNAARDNRIFRIEENVLNYFGPRSGENIAKVAALIHKK